MQRHLKLTIVVARSLNGVIGRDGGLPWHLPEDLRHFKAVTMGHAIIMGRKTWDSIGRALPGRHSIVITRQVAFEAKGADVVQSLEAALEAAVAAGDEEPCIIGGASLYQMTLPIASRLELTEVDAVVEGDTMFPELDEAAWTETGRRSVEGAIFRTLERR